MISMSRASSAALSLLLVLFRFLECLARTPNKTAVAGMPHFPALLMFGDSILDTGNNNYLHSIAKCDFPPYGKDFINHQPTGRFSNGKVPSDMIASILGIKETLPPYLSTIQGDDNELLTGVCFASGATGFDPLTAEMLSVLSLPDQLDLFKKYKERLAVIAGEEKAAQIISESLYVVCGGSNDVVNTYFGAQVRKVEYSVSDYLSFLVNKVSGFVQDLYDVGARKIGVVGLPPLGCLPSQRTIAGGSERDCVIQYNQASIEYNNKLFAELQRLSESHSGTKIIYIDIYDSLLDLVQQPHVHGFQETSKGCCGTGEYELSIMCNDISTSACDDDSQYVFWDSFHPTQRAYEILVQQVKEKYLPLFLEAL